ncbi:MAG: hypothetical protein ABI042_10530 [Verrucomicrobiota bacterium]
MSCGLLGTNEMRISSKTKTVETRLILAMLLDKGWSTRDLAKKIGVDQRFVSNEVSKNFQCPSLRVRIEEVFHRRIFSTQEEYDLREYRKEIFGFDPGTKTVVQLRAFAVQNSIHLERQRTKKRIIEVISAALIARENSTNPTK